MIDNPTSGLYNAISNRDVFLYISKLYDWGSVYDSTGGNMAEQPTGTTPQGTFPYLGRLSSRAARHHRAACAGRTTTRHPAYGVG